MSLCLLVIQWKNWAMSLPNAAILFMAMKFSDLLRVGKGITIHRISCPNARQLISKYDYRVIDVKWRQTDDHKTYLTTIQVSGNDELGILNNITKVISDDLKVNMVSVNVDTRWDGKFMGKFKVSVKDTMHLEMLIHKILKVKGVKKAKRSEIEV